MKKKLVTLALSILFISSVQAQIDSQTRNLALQHVLQSHSDTSKTHVTLNRTINFTAESGNKEINVDVKKGVKGFELSIQSYVESGNITIEIIDPSGTKQGHYSIGTQMNSKAKEKVTGSITKSLKQPMEGKWVIKITLSSASGGVQIKTSLID